MSSSLEHWGVRAFPFGCFALELAVGSAGEDALHDAVKDRGAGGPGGAIGSRRVAGDSCRGWLGSGGRRSEMGLVFKRGAAGSAEAFQCSVR